MNFIDRSIEIAYQLYPIQYEQHPRAKSHHFAFAWERNTLLSIGQNNCSVMNSKALWLAKRFNTGQTKFPYLHAETDLISRLWGKTHIDSRIKIVVIRIDKNGLLRNSKPCKNCQQVLDGLDIRKLWWSTEEGMSNVFTDY